MNRTGARKAYAWVALVAIALNSAWPLLANAKLRARRADPIGEICSAYAKNPAFLLTLFSSPFRDPKRTRLPQRASSHRGSLAMGPRVLAHLPSQARIVEKAHGFFVSCQQDQRETGVSR